MDEPAKDSVDATESSGGIMTECGTNQPIEKALAAEDAVSSHVIIFWSCISLA